VHRHEQTPAKVPLAAITCTHDLSEPPYGYYYKVRREHDANVLRLWMCLQIARPLALASTMGIPYDARVWGTEDDVIAMHALALSQRMELAKGTLLRRFSLQPLQSDEKAKWVVFTPGSWLPFIWPFPPHQPIDPHREAAQLYRRLSVDERNQLLRRVNKNRLALDLDFLFPADLEPRKDVESTAANADWYARKAKFVPATYRGTSMRELKHVLAEVRVTCLTEEERRLNKRYLRFLEDDVLAFDSMLDAMSWAKREHETQRMLIFAFRVKKDNLDAASAPAKAGQLERRHEEAVRVACDVQSRQIKKKGGTREDQNEPVPSTQTVRKQAFAQLRADRQRARTHGAHLIAQGTLDASHLLFGAYSDICLF